MKTIRIANAGGYWGDDPEALQRQVKGGELDFITMDYLAEITMSILNKQRQRDPEFGSARDFLHHLEPVITDVMERKIRIITNAGGVNPDICARNISEMATRYGLKPRIAIVDGDNILEQLDQLTAEGVDFSNMETGESFEMIRDRVTAANLYFGALPVIKALEAGADIVVTGRVTDTGITLAPIIASFGWSLDDYDKLASGIVAGHILECGAQSTGGNFTDWEKVPAFHRMGYPIAEIAEDGSFVITKHDSLDGLVSVDTVREQLLYEMGDPLHYITPDVIADFTSIQLEDAGTDRVRVTGVTGRAPTDLLKVSMAYSDGYKSYGTILVSGPDARRKAEKFSEIFWSRVDTVYEDQLTEYVGANACHRHLAPAQEPGEILLRFAVRDHDREKLTPFRRNLAALILSGPPSVAVTGGTPPVRDVVSYWPALVPQSIADWRMRLYQGCELLHGEHGGWPETAGDMGSDRRVADPDPVDLGGKTVRSPLMAIALARSGDKGDTCNVGILARSRQAWEWIGATLTPERVKDIYGDLVLGPVERHAVPNLLAFNYLLHQALGGGGTRSLRVDAQGKTMAHALLSREFDIPEQVMLSVEDPDV